MASELRVDKIIPTSGVPTGGGGGIIQVVSTTKTDAALVEDISAGTIGSSNKIISPFCKWMT